MFPENFREIEDRLDRLENRERCESFYTFVLALFLSFLLYFAAACLIRRVAEWLSRP